MAQLAEYIDTYRGWHIVRVTQKGVRTLDSAEGLTNRVLGFVPRISPALRRNPRYSSRTYSLGLPRSLDKVKEWIDRQEELLDG